jgi:hypothetical protein
LPPDLDRLPELLRPELLDLEPELERPDDLTDDLPLDREDPLDRLSVELLERLLDEDFDDLL